jgi:hypothetical protein
LDGGAKTMTERAAQRGGLSSPLGVALRTAFASLLLLQGTGCSLILTKGPEPELKPPPPCTSTVEAPVADTLLAGAAAALTVVGVLTASSPCPSSTSSGFGSLCFNSVGWIGAAVGGVLTIFFLVSAGVGYTRTSACRASLAAPAPARSTTSTSMNSSFLASSVPGCGPTGDAPRLCALPSRAGDGTPGPGR